MSTFVMPSLGADMESAVLMEWKVEVIVSPKEILSPK